MFFHILNGEGRKGRCLINNGGKMLFQMKVEEIIAKPMDK